jgi:pimeloyl-ACP methyl ester carboxylesterase
MANSADFHTSTYVFVHGSAGAGAQWRDMAALLAPSARCLCPDLVGYGSGPAFDRGSYRFEQEIAIVEQALETAGSSSILVGHSFGGVVALAAAMARPELVARLVLIEPVAFTLLDSTEHRASRQRLLAFCKRIDELVELGRTIGKMRDAAEAFFRFWELSGLWHALSDKRKKMIELVMPKVAAECALIHAPAFTALDVTRRLSVPTLVLRGSASPPLEREVCAVVAGASPCCTLAELPGANHMSPLLRPQEVLTAIRDFSARAADHARPGCCAEGKAAASPHAATIPTHVV